MRNVSREVKKALNEINSSTYLNAADRQEALLNDDDYIMSHTSKQLAHNKQRAQQFRDFGNFRKDEEYFDQRQNDIKNKKNDKQIISEFCENMCDPFLNQLNGILTHAILREAVLSALYDNDFYDVICGGDSLKPRLSYGPPRSEMIQAIETLYNRYAFSDNLDEIIINDIVQEINKTSSVKYKKYNYMIVPENFNIPNTYKKYINDINDYIYNQEQENLCLNDIDCYNEIAKEELLDRSYLKWDGNKIDCDFNDDADGCKFKYFIDCTQDGEISDWCDKHYTYNNNDIVYIKNSNASEYSEYVGILCKYKRDANEIVKEMGEYTEREWEAPGVWTLSKQPATLWTLKDSLGIK